MLFMWHKKTFKVKHKHIYIFGKNICCKQIVALWLCLLAPNTYLNFPPELDHSFDKYADSKPSDYDKSR